MRLSFASFLHVTASWELKKFSQLPDSWTVHPGARVAQQVSAHTKLRSSILSFSSAQRLTHRVLNARHVFLALKYNATCDTRSLVGAVGPSRQRRSRARRPCELGEGRWSRPPPRGALDNKRT